MTTVTATKEWCLRMARLEGDAAIGAGVGSIPGQLTPRAPHIHWFAYPEAEVLFNCVQAAVEGGCFPTAVLARITSRAYDIGAVEAAAYIAAHKPVGNKFPDCSANSYFSNVTLSAQLLSATADTLTCGYTLRGVLAEIGEAYRMGWEARFEAEVAR